MLERGPRRQLKPVAAPAELPYEDELEQEEGDEADGGDKRVRVAPDIARPPHGSEGSKSESESLLARRAEAREKRETAISAVEKTRQLQRLETVQDAKSAIRGALPALKGADRVLQDEASRVPVQAPSVAAMERPAKLSIWERAKKAVRSVFRKDKSKPDPHAGYSPRHAPLTLMEAEKGKLAQEVRARRSRLMGAILALGSTVAVPQLVVHDMASGRFQQRNVEVTGKPDYRPAITDAIEIAKALEKAERRLLEGRLEDAVQGYINDLGEIDLMQNIREGADEWAQIQYERKVAGDSALAEIQADHDR